MLNTAKWFLSCCELQIDLWSFKVEILCLLTLYRFDVMKTNTNTNNGLNTFFHTFFINMTFYCNVLYTLLLDILQKHQVEFITIYRLNVLQT